MWILCFLCILLLLYKRVVWNNDAVIMNVKKKWTLVILVRISISLINTTAKSKLRGRKGLSHFTIFRSHSTVVWIRMASTGSCVWRRGPQLDLFRKHQEVWLCWRSCVMGGGWAFEVSEDYRFQCAFSFSLPSIYNSRCERSAALATMPSLLHHGLSGTLSRWPWLWYFCHSNRKLSKTFHL